MPLPFAYAQENEPLATSGEKRYNKNNRRFGGWHDGEVMGGLDYGMDRLANLFKNGAGRSPC